MDLASWLYIWLLGLMLDRPWDTAEKDGTITLLFRIVGGIMVLAGMIGGILTFSHFSL